MLRSSEGRREAKAHLVQLSPPHARACFRHWATWKKHTLSLALPK